MGSVLQIPVVLCWSLAAAFAAPGDGSVSVTNIFSPLSTPAEAIHENALLVLVICAGIFLIVGGLLAYTIIRFRRRPADAGREPPQVYGSNQIELAWTVVLILIVFVLIVVTARTIADIQNAARPPRRTRRDHGRSPVVVGNSLSRAWDRNGA